MQRNYLSQSQLSGGWPLKFMGIIIIMNNTLDDNIMCIFFKYSIDYDTERIDCKLRLKGICRGFCSTELIMQKYHVCNIMGIPLQAIFVVPHPSPEWHAH